MFSKNPTISFVPVRGVTVFAIFFGVLGCNRVLIISDDLGFKVRVGYIYYGLPLVYIVSFTFQVKLGLLYCRLLPKQITSGLIN
jgi:hypothetical protein